MALVSAPSHTKDKYKYKTGFKQVTLNTARNKVKENNG